MGRLKITLAAGMLLVLLAALNFAELRLLFRPRPIDPQLHYFALSVLPMGDVAAILLFRRARAKDRARRFSDGFLALGLAALGVQVSCQLFFPAVGRSYDAAARAFFSYCLTYGVPGSIATRPDGTGYFRYAPALALLFSAPQFVAGLIGGVLASRGVLFVDRRNQAPSAEEYRADEARRLRPRVEAARLEFARSLVGRWTTEAGSFNQVMGQHWEIRADGTGRYIDTGPFGHPTAETRFEWRQSEAFVFELRLTEYISHDPACGYDIDDEDRTWRVIRYDFVASTTDCGSHVGLVDVTRAGSEREGFHESLASLAYVGPVTEDVPT